MLSVGASLPYFEQSPNIPLDPSLAFSTTTNGTFSIHNELLEYGATLGLVGTLLWLLALVLALGGAYRARGTPVTAAVAARARAGDRVLCSDLERGAAERLPELILRLWLGVVWSGYVFTTPPGRARRAARSS